VYLNLKLCAVQSAGQLAGLTVGMFRRPHLHMITVEHEVTLPQLARLTRCEPNRPAPKYMTQVTERLKRGLLPLLPVMGVALAAALVEAKHRDYEVGTVVSMNSVPCGTQQKRHKKTEALLCHEYVLRSGN